MSDDKSPSAPTSPNGTPTPPIKSSNSSTDLAQQQQQTLLQQQLQQQQLQLLQLQQQQLQSLSQNMSASELTALQHQQQQLALFMMPMFPLMMPPLQQLPNAVSSATHETLLTAAEAATASDQAAAEAAEAAADAAVAAAHSEVLPSYSPASAESLGLASSFGSSDAFGLLPGTTLPSAAAAGLNLDDVPKRKRGRPPKKDVAARAKGEVEKALKQQQQQQMPLWGYGLPMPLLPGFPPGMLSGMSNPGAVVMKGDHATCEDELEQEGDAERPSKTAKKKQRGTGKPRGRPRTRPRPGEIIRRVKPLPIAPANFSVMYNYSLSNLAHKSAELNGDGSVADTDATTGTDEAQDRGLASLSASLLSGEHE